MRLRYPPTDYLERMGLVMLADPDGLYAIRNGRVRFEYPPCVMGGQVWEGPGEVDNATKRLAVGMYALQTADEWCSESKSTLERAISETRRLYSSRPDLLEAPGRLTVEGIMIELQALLRPLKVAGNR
jgi:hypothetical protein